MNHEQCVYYEEGKCVQTCQDCRKPCDFIQEKMSLRAGLLWIAACAIILFFWSGIIYGIATYQAKQILQCGAVECMQYRIAGEWSCEKYYDKKGGKHVESTRN